MKKIKISFHGALLLIFLALFFGIGIISPDFFSPDYIIGVMLRNIIEIGLVALPVTFVIITGGIDLSVGSTMLLSAIIGGFVGKDYGSFAGVLATLAVGCACGFLNAFLIVKNKISPLVTTLATMFLFLGIAKGVSGGNSAYSFSVSTALGTTELFNMLPIQIVIYILFALLFNFIISKSPFGRKLYSIGFNENASKYAGIDIDKIKFIIYITSSLICSVAALIYLGRFSSVNVSSDPSFNLKVVTVIVLGGTSILGGVGDIKGTVIATLIIAVLNSGLTIMNIPVDTQTIVQGTVLIISLITYAVINNKSKVKTA